MGQVIRGLDLVGLADLTLQLKGELPAAAPGFAQGQLAHDRIRLEDCTLVADGHEGAVAKGDSSQRFTRP